MAAAAAMRRRRKRRIPVARIIVLGLFLLLMFGPLYWLVITSIKPSDDFLAVPPVWFPENPTWLHYEASMFSSLHLPARILHSPTLKRHRLSRYWAMAVL